MRVAETASGKGVNVNPADPQLRTYSVLLWALPETNPERNLLCDLDMTVRKSTVYKRFRNFLKMNQCTYVWVDSWSLSESSTAPFAETAEAVLLLYEWLKKAEFICVYLGDVGGKEEITKSSWFRQVPVVQLVAPPPRRMHFYDRDWKYLGDKGDLVERLSAATSVPAYILLHVRDPKFALYGEKVSWTPNGVARMWISLLGVTINIPPRLPDETLCRLAAVQVLQSQEDYTALMCRKPFGLASWREEHVGDEFEQSLQEPSWPAMQLHSPANIKSAELQSALPRFSKPPDSPQLTPRGMLVTLFAKNVRTFVIAWTYCTMEIKEEFYAVCIRVTKNTPFDSEHIQHDYFQGATSGKVCHVRVERLRGFELKNIYFSIEGDV
ncbi:hypothetical protein M011DRAFT_466346 [Sporormia fimetaria CBS 119925]|uniref:Heterokaryon incompatibility domain-containing protein n=1 Tax=Sporormia fimetaria CBS 119925 TaxID=1340428 RepID=A0A6A6VHF0_9PLEO|nr:hypothetical protein M011DRAFT_466346 [Sporormia fimetaria CBS 119925]